MTRLDAALAGPALWPHQRTTIDRVHAHFAADPTVVALLLTGSIAHGFATAASDVDIVIVVGPDEWERRRAATALTYLNHDLATYAGGYVDGKFVSLPFLRDVAERGGDATRWGYEGARVLFTRDPELPAVLSDVVSFPTALRSERRARFVAQLLAWRWYGEQGVDKGDPYLTTMARARVALFACRIVLNQNDMLYPFHKWLLRVTGQAPRRPADVVDRVRALLAGDAPWAQVDAFVDDLLAFYEVDRAEAECTWGAHFLRDTEVSWLAGPPAVDDL